MRKDKRLRDDKRFGGCHNPITMGKPSMNLYEWKPYVPLLSGLKKEVSREVPGGFGQFHMRFFLDFRGELSPSK